MCLFTPVYPGSHDAMSYCLDINSPLVQSESDLFRLLDGLFYCLTRPAIFKWATTQVCMKCSSSQTTCADHDVTMSKWCEDPNGTKKVVPPRNHLAA